MALTLGVRVGEKVFVGDSVLVVTKLIRKGSFVITYDGLSILISEDTVTQVSKDVSLSSGVGGRLFAKVVFFAPPTTIITREALRC